MFKSFFNKKIDNDVSNNLNIGLTKTNPILVSSIPSSYSYLNTLCTMVEGLSYERIGSVQTEEFSELMDKYTFVFNNNKFCDIFIYPDHSENNFIIPTPFKTLNPNLDNSIFNFNEKEESNNSDEQSLSNYLYKIVDLTLLKNGDYNDPDVKWTHDKEEALNHFKQQLGYEDEIEKLILDEYNKAKSNLSSINKNEFAFTFLSNFHNKKLTQFAPNFVLERNENILSAYNSIIETINRIQAWLDNSLIRKRIQISTLEDINDNKLGIFIINQCVTPFFVIRLICDVFGRFKLLYGVDSRILDMIPADMASTLLRRIYEFTPGGLEPFVGFDSLNMDCISYFESLMEDAEKENYSIIEVERHKEKSISDMFNNLEFRDDLDDETRKWLKR